MFRLNTKLLLMFLSIIIGIYFILSLLLKISIYNTNFIIIFVMLFFLIVLVHGCKTLGYREFLVFFIIAYIITMLYEYTYGLGFGEFFNCKPYYSDLLGPKFIGKIPYIIPLVWSISFYCAFTMTNIIFNKIKTNPIYEEVISYKWVLNIFGMGLVSGLIMASWDLINDPLMVRVGAWSWSYQGLYYGIPLLNFEGWIEIPLVIFIVYSFYLNKVKKVQVYIGGEEQSNYTLIVVLLYLALFIIYSIYAYYENVSNVIPWASITMIPISIITTIKFFKNKTKK